MADPRKLTPQAFEILGPREIRKTGLDVADVRVNRRVKLVDEDGNALGFALELAAQLVVDSESRTALIACRSEPESVGAEAIDGVHASARRSQARHACLFSATGYTAEAVARAGELGIALLVIIDGPAAFARSEWGSGGPAPSWVPEHMAELVVTESGQSAQRPITPDRASLLLQELRE